MAETFLVSYAILRVALLECLTHFYNASDRGSFPNMVHPEVGEIREDDEAAWTDTDSLSGYDPDPHHSERSPLQLRPRSSEDPMTVEGRLHSSPSENDPPPPLSRVPSFDAFEDVLRNEMSPYRRAYGARTHHHSAFGVHDSLLENMLTNVPPHMRHLLDIIADRVINLEEENNATLH